MLDFSDAGNILINGSSLTTINLFEIYYDSDPEVAPVRYAGWDEDVTFGGEVYSKSTIQVSDLTTDTDGKINDVTLTVGNANRIIQYYIEMYDLIGKKVRHIQIFEGVSDFIATTFKIKGAKAKKNVAVFTLSLGVDFLTAIIPARTVHARMCWHQFKGVDGDCGYDGIDTVCDHSFGDCKRKLNIARIGSFPAIPNERIYF